MCNRSFLIGDITFKVIEDFQVNPVNLELAWMSEDATAPCVEIKVVGNEQLKVEESIKNKDSLFGIKTSSGFRLWLKNEEGRVAYQIDANRSWDDLTVKMQNHQRLPFLGGIGEVIFRTALLFHQGIVFHAAAISHKGKGLLFSAPSGTGKTTHVNFWVQHTAANILNGDRAALRIKADDIWVYGTPWSGSSRQHDNKKVPLAGIFLIEQSSYNLVEEINSSEKLRHLAARCYLPYFDEELMGRALDIIGEVVQRVPVYRLKCRPNKEAMEKVLQWMF